MKLSWHEAHLRFVPRKTCEITCADCISLRWLAFTTPRQTIPLMNPSDPGTGLMSSRTNSSYGMSS